MATSSRRARRALARGEKAYKRLCLSTNFSDSKRRRKAGLGAQNSPMAIIDPLTGFFITDVGKHGLR